MKKFKKFYFESFEFDKIKLEAKFNYSFDKKEFFSETINFNDKNFSLRKNLDLEVINNILFHIHIVLGISYYKIYPTEDLIVESGFLDNYQINFWKNFYLNGLGEFLYTNKISPTNLFNFINNSQIKYIKKDFELGNNILVPIGGGKDSIVSIELLKKSGFNIDLYSFGPKDNILYSNTQEISGNNRLFIKRKIQNLKEYINKGYYNGHVPITGIIAFVSELVCYLYDYRYIVLSNEKSASQENIIWEGIKINHQYSKSLEFEKDFSNYVSKYVSGDIKYFSLLRGMYEFKIAKLFSENGKKYFNKFASCNNNFKIFKNPLYNPPPKGEGTGKSIGFTSPSSGITRGLLPLGSRGIELCSRERCSGVEIERGINKLEKNSLWCNSCPKCAFVFLILSNFLTEEELINIFGENLFDKENLESTFRELIGLNNYKPFECVGTYEESFLSLYNAIKKYDFNLPLELRNISLRGNRLIKSKIPFILKKLKKEVLEKSNKIDIKKLEYKLLKIYDEDIIPLEIKNKLKN